MRKRTIRDTELDVILDDIKSYSLSDEGKAYITPDLITDDEEVLNSRYIRIDEIMNKLESSAPLEKFPSLSKMFLHVKQSHRDIDGSLIYACGEFLSSLFLLLHFDEKDDLITSSLEELKDDILFSLDYEGSVNLEHPRLKALVRKRDEVRAERYRFSVSYIQENRAVVQNENPVFRNERVVIPVYTKDKKQGEYYVSGISQDRKSVV